MRALLAILIASALAGCSDRERSNPFDPKNPRTQGGPAGFMALAGNGRVDLRWTTVSGEGLLGYRIDRRTAAESVFTTISNVLPPNVGSYSDLGLLNGLEHRYRIRFVFDDGGRGPAAEDVATPGSARPWVAEAGGNRLIRVTPDARRIAATFGFAEPIAVAVDSARGTVWVAEEDAVRQVTVLDPITGVRVAIPGLVDPRYLAVDPLARVAWVSDAAGNKVYAFDASGALVGAPIEPIQLPQGIAVDPVDRSVWICERLGDRVRRYSADRALIWSVPLENPSRVAIDSLNHRGWVSSYTQGTVSRIREDGFVEVTRPNLAGPLGLAVDSRRSRVWVAELDGGAAVALDFGADVEFRVTGLPGIQELSVDRETGEVWAVLPEAGEVVRIAPDGRILGRLGGLASPWDVSVDPGSP